ncbi:MAG TPA: glycosyltransferase family 39 protein [Gaiellales bacterium]|nr:glycosyltransferase family 39 protein [Gaiellales bacterium]
MLLAVLARLPFLHTPLTADEGGYAEVARLWSHGAVLYQGAWVDRPQGLLIIFRAMLHVDGGSAEAFRALAAVAGALVVAVTMVVTARLAGRIPATIAGLAMATVGAAPFIESFTLSGELLASVFAVASLLAFVFYLERPAPGWLIAAGLLTGCAVLVKQSAFDAGAAAAVYLVWTRRRGGVAPAAALVAAAFVPVVIAAATAQSFHDWWYAMVTYRDQADSILTGSFHTRLHQARLSLPAAERGLGALALLALAGWRRWPLLGVLWLGFATLAVIGGGNFHNHYYQQMVPPLALLAGIGGAELLRRRKVAWAAVVAIALAATVFVTAPLWFDSPNAQARTIFPDDPHLQTDAQVVRYVRAHTRPGQHIFVMWAAADLYYLSGRDPSFRYMWFRNIQAIPGALGQARRMLAGKRPPALVVGINSPASMDPSGRTQRILDTRFRKVATVAGVPIYAPR